MLPDLICILTLPYMLHYRGWKSLVRIRRTNITPGPLLFLYLRSSTIEDEKHLTTIYINNVEARVSENKIN